MSTKNNASLIASITLIITVIGVFGTLIWDWWNSSKQISILKVQNVAIVETAERIDGLKITYGDKRISELSRVHFEIRNSGQIPIEEADVKEPVNIQLEYGEILSAVVVETYPENLQVELDQKERNISVRFNLLNPDDRVTVSVLTDEANASFSAEARISGVKRIQLGAPPNQKILNENIGAGTYISLVACVFFIWIIVTLRSNGPKRKEVLEQIGQKTPLYDAGSEFSDVKKFIEEKLSFLSTNDRAELMRELYKLSDPLEADEVRGFHGLLTEKIMKDDSDSSLEFNVGALALVTGFFAINGLFF